MCHMLEPVTWHGSLVGLLSAGTEQGFSSVCHLLTSSPTEGVLEQKDKLYRYSIRADFFQEESRSTPWLQSETRHSASVRNSEPSHPHQISLSVPGTPEPSAAMLKFACLKQGAPKKEASHAQLPVPDVYALPKVSSSWPWWYEAIVLLLSKEAQGCLT